MFDPTDPVPFVMAAFIVAIVLFLRGVLWALLRLMLDVIGLLVRGKSGTVSRRQPPQAVPHRRSSQHPLR
jgi:hypothetical protein